MHQTWNSFLARWAPMKVVLVTWACLCMVATGGLANQALANDLQDGDAPNVPRRLDLRPGETVENLFEVMALMPEADALCQGGAPLVDAEEIAPGRFACGTFRNIGDRAGVWRIDFEESLSGGYAFDILRGTTVRPILSSDAALVTLGMPRVASLPIVIAPSETVMLRVQLLTPSDVDDADPVLRPEAAFVIAATGRAQGIGALLGASTILVIFFAAFAQLLGSRPARHYALYFAATTLAIASAEGYLRAVLPWGDIVATSVLNKALEAAQITLHISFMATFLAQALPDHRAPSQIKRLALGALAALALAAVLSVALGGKEGWLRYHDVGLELDPLLESPTLPSLIAVGVLLAWIFTIVVTAALLLRRQSNGARLYALGAGILAISLVVNSFADLVFDDLDDDLYWFQYMLLLDGMLFAAAIVRQTFGLRAQRNAALAKELAAVQEQARLSQNLLQTRQDRDRAQDLAETHRSRLALASHDLRQPLTSLRLAIDDADLADPTLGDTLRRNLAYLKGLLDTTLAESAPIHQLPQSSAHEPPRTGYEDVPISLVLTNAVHMFRDEANDKALRLTCVDNDLVVHTDPIALIRIVSNLTSNAVKYTQSGEVCLRADTPETGPEIQVYDTGPGLSAAQIEDILRPYQRGDSAQDVDGTGLGLSSVQELAHSLGLLLLIDSTPGQGSTFRLSGFDVVTEQDT